MNQTISDIFKKFQGMPRDAIIMTHEPSKLPPRRIIRTGTVVKLTSGKESVLCGLGDTGKISRTCEYTGFRYIILTKHRKDPTYFNHEFGPFSDIEFEVQ